MYNNILCSCAYVRMYSIKNMGYGKSKSSIKVGDNNFDLNAIFIRYITVYVYILLEILVQFFYEY